MVAGSHAEEEAAPIAIGVDGAPAGWAAACLRGGGAPVTEVRLFASIAEIAAFRGHAVVAIDVPIGLLDTVELRPCDREARRRLGPRASSVFAPPSRPMLRLAGNYPAMRAHVEVERRSQPAAIASKVAEVDDWVRAHADSEGWLYECHPEVTFAALNGGAPLADKRSGSGLLARLRLVGERFPDAEERLAAAPWPGRAVAAADLLDAYAALTTALRCARGEHELLAAGRDRLGIPMRIAL
jgi:predicted RNase H-like nuclease